MLNLLGKDSNLGSYIEKGFLNRLYDEFYKCPSAFINFITNMQDMK